MVQGFSTKPGTEGPLKELRPEGTRKVWRWAVLISMGGFLFGFDTGVVSGALLFIKSDFDLDALQQSSVVSVLLLGAIVGALGAGRLADPLGRRKTLGLVGVVFVVGTAVAVLATGYWMLLLARVVLGLAVGAASATVPVYLSEVSPTDIRGRVLSTNQLMITVGVLVAYVVNLVFSGSADWRAMFAVGAVPALVILAAALWLLPESPEWLLGHGRRDEARTVIASVSNAATADKLIDDWQRRTDQAKSADDRPARKGWKVLLDPQVRPALIVGLTLAALQQLGGINTIIYYAPTIIEQTGLSASNAILYSVAIGIINLVMTLVSIQLVDRVGRRPMLLFSLAGMAVSLALLGLAFVAGWSPVLVLTFMVLYIAAFGVGLGPVFWVLVGEIFPPKSAAAGSSVATTVNWTANFAVSLMFLSVVNAIGQGETFWIFAAVCVMGLLFVSRFVPETRGRDAAQVQTALWARFGRQQAGTAPTK